MTNLPSNREPSRPGEVLLREFLIPLHLTQSRLAQRMRVPVQLVNTVVKGKRSVTPKTAVLLARVLGTSPEFWMTLQQRLDLYHARQRMNP